MNQHSRLFTRSDEAAAKARDESGHYGDNGQTIKVPAPFRANADELARFKASLRDQSHKTMGLPVLKGGAK